MVSDNVVLTAAHCVTDDKYDTEKIVVIAGVLDLRFAGAEERRIADTKVHPDYESPAVYFDVALIILDKPLEFSSRISSICLPSSSDEFQSLTGLGVTVQGWGTNEEGETGVTLTQIDVSIRSNDECNYFYKNTVRRSDALRVQIFLPELINDSMFCANSNVGDKIGTCHGDSGGPSFVRSVLTKYPMIIFTNQGIRQWTSSVHFGWHCWRKSSLCVNFSRLLQFYL